jgi:hypothetical protein
MIKLIDIIDWPSQSEVYSTTKSKSAEESTGIRGLKISNELVTAFPFASLLKQLASEAMGVCCF